MSLSLHSGDKTPMAAKTSSDNPMAVNGEQNSVREVHYEFECPLSRRTALEHGPMMNFRRRPEAGTWPGYPDDRTQAINGHSSNGWTGTQNQLDSAVATLIRTKHASQIWETYFHFRPLIARTVQAYIQP